MKILIVTDAWTPQVNGVVRTLHGARRARGDGQRVAGHLARPVPLDALPDLSGDPAGARPGRHGRRAHRRRSMPDALHIATEGPLGLAARHWCVRRGLRLHHRLSHPVSRICRESAPGCRRPGSGATSAGSIARPSAVMVSTPTHRRRSCARAACRSTRRWGRGVDLALFRARRRAAPARSPPAAADPALCRPGRGREEYRGVPRLPASGHARWWSATARRWPR